MEEQDKITFFIFVINVFCIFSFVVFIKTVLFVLSDKLPVCNMLYVEDHIMSKDKLTRCFLEGNVGDLTAN